VAFIVRASGQVTNITVVQADDVLYGEAAASAVSKWKFSPAQIKGAPVDCRMTLPFIFDSPYGYDSGPGTESLPSGDRPPDASHPMTIESH
jgi:iron complex outermembrane receptor protein